MLLPQIATRAATERGLPDALRQDGSTCSNSLYIKHGSCCCCEEGHRRSLCKPGQQVPGRLLLSTRQSSELQPFAAVVRRETGAVCASLGSRYYGMCRSDPGKAQSALQLCCLDT